MKFIVVGDELPKSYSLECSIETLMWCVACIVSMLMIFLVSIYFAVNRGDRLDLIGQGIQDLKEQVLLDKYESSQFYEYANSVFLAYAKQTGELQAKVTRVETLGARLASMANLDEFDFSSPPPMGGIEITAPTPSDNILNISKELTQHLRDRELQLQAIEGLLANNQKSKDSYIAGKPLSVGWLTSGFGRRIDPFKGTQAWHSGVDYTSRAGAAIHAVAAGVVMWSGERTGYGNVVEIDHGDGIITRYAHNKTNKVAVGDLVTRGQVIAIMGSSGRSTGSHVHFEVLKKGVAVDPIPYIYRKIL